ncbi:MAG TPA: cytidine deaminase [Peptococcaceae bacterium]|nr:cytidine deaminase [Peptococcaceae bacterium]
MDNKYADLIAMATKAWENAYAPYSGYRVGAAVLWDSGRITAGSNVENSSYGLTVCAERNAIFQGVALGERKIKALAVAVPDANLPTPCGACRQVIREFADDCDVVLVNGQGETKLASLQELLPFSFGPEFLKGQG